VSFRWFFLASVGSIEVFFEECAFLSFFSFEKSSKTMELATNRNETYGNLCVVY